MLDQHEEDVLLYQHIGKLFYAIASADGTIRNEEILGLEKMIKKYWMADQHKPNASLIYDGFNDQLMKKTDPETCFNDFMEYRKSSPHKFTEELRSAIVKSAHEIAASFSNKNKSELIFLAKLSIDLRS